MVQRLARKRAHEANKAAAKDLQEAMEAVSTAERSGPDCGDETRKTMRPVGPGL
jgi:hypothetical protein